MLGFFDVVRHRGGLRRRLLLRRLLLRRLLLRRLREPIAVFLDTTGITRRQVLRWLRGNLALPPSRKAGENLRQRIFYDLLTQATLFLSYVVPTKMIFQDCAGVYACTYSHLHEVL